MITSTTISLNSSPAVRQTPATPVSITPVTTSVQQPRPNSSSQQKLLEYKINKDEVNGEAKLVARMCAFNTLQKARKSKKETLIYGSSGSQKAGKSELMTTLTGLNFETGQDEYMKTTEGIDIGLLETEARVEIILDSQGTNSSHTLREIADKVREWNPQLTSEELNAIALRLMEQQEKKLGEFLYQTCDVIIRYSLGPKSRNEDVAFLETVSKGHSNYFKPIVFLVVRGLTPTKFSVFKNKMEEELTNVKERFRRIEYFSVTDFEPQLQETVEEYRKDVMLIRQRLNRCFSLRYQTPREAYALMKNVLCKISTAPSSQRVYNWVGILSCLRGNAAPSSPSAEERKATEILKYLQECYDCTLGLIPDLRKMKKKLEFHSEYLFTTAAEIESITFKNRVAQTGLSAISASAAVTGAATATATGLIVGGVITAAPIALPVLATAAAVATGVGVAVGGAALLSQAVSDVRSSKKNKNATTKMSKEQAAIESMIERVKKFAALEKRPPACFARDEEGDLQVLMQWYFAFRAQDKKASNEEIGKRVLRSYHVSMNVPEIESHQVSEYDAQTGLNVINTPSTASFHGGKVVASMGQAAAATSMVVIRVAPTLLTRLGPQITVAAVSVLPILNLVSVGIDAVIIGINAHKLRNNTTTKEAEQVRELYVTVDKCLKDLTTVHSSFSAVLDACYSTIGGIEKELTLEDTIEYFIKCMEENENSNRRLSATTIALIRKDLTILHRDRANHTMEYLSSNLKKLREKMDSLEPDFEPRSMDASAGHPLN